MLYAYYLLQIVGVTIFFGTFSAWLGLAVGMAFLSFLVWLTAFANRRLWRLTAAEVGTTRIEVQAGRGRVFSRKARLTLFFSCAAVFGLGLVLQAGDLLQHHWSGKPLNWTPMIRQLTVSILCLSGAALNLRNPWQRLLFTEHGLFQVFDPRNPWTPDRELDEPNSSLRAKKLHDWGDVVGFHWTKQADLPTLHLKVLWPGTKVPQLVTISFASLSDDARRSIDDLLQKCIKQTLPPEANLPLSTSATGSTLD
jgi:hypothetical protein